MDESKVLELTKLLEGVSSSEWSRIKQNIDMTFSHKATKVKIESADLENLEHNIATNLNLRRYSEKTKGSF